VQVARTEARSLTKQETEELAAWLGDHACDIFLRWLDGLRLKRLAEAVEEIAQGSPLKVERAAALAAEARRLAHFIGLIRHARSSTPTQIHFKVELSEHTEKTSPETPIE
jgi:hypothetical protein